MKSCSATLRNARRVRQLASESSDDSDDQISLNISSVRAEKCTSRGHVQSLARTKVDTSTLCSASDESVLVRTDRTLFRLSDSSDSESLPSVQADKCTLRRHLKPLASINVNTLSTTGNKSVFQSSDKTLFRLSESSKDTSYDDKNTSSMNNSSISSIFKPSKNIKQSNDENKSKNSDFDMPNNNYVSDDSDNSEIREVLEESIQSFTRDITSNESFFITPKAVKTKRRIILDSSDEDDVEQTSLNNSVSKGNSQIVEYESDSNKNTSSLNTSSVFDSSKYNFNEYRTIKQSNDDDQSKNSDFYTPNDTFESDNNSEIEEIVEESIQSFTGDITKNESFFITPKTVKPKPRIISDSSDESDVEQIYNHVSKEKSKIVEYESDDDIIISPKEIIKTPISKSQIEIKLEDLSLIEPSESETDTSDLNKSFSPQNQPTFDKLNNSRCKNTSTSLLDINTTSELSDLKGLEANVSYEKCIDVINENEDLKLPRLSFPESIDLTEAKYNDHSSPKSISNSKKLTTDEYESLKMEKRRLEEIISRFSENINKMKNTIRSISLNLLPDGGLKIKSAISKEEKSLKESQMQLYNVVGKLNKFPERLYQAQSTNSDFFKPLDMNPLIKKAATNIDIDAMGSKAYNTYRAQQAMTLDVLQGLHKSLESCPTANMLADDPKGLKVELMDHQKHAIAWLMWRESQKPYGGILADDMGLGKTLTMIALILKSSEMKADEEESGDSDDSNHYPKHNTIKGGTLVICTASLISQWENEIKSKIHPKLLDVVQYYGPNRETSPRRLARKNIVITTYNVVMRDQKHANTSPLFQIKWNRIILDEAHCIRNYKSQTSVAVSKLYGLNRWALSGTPIHNKETDFYALIKFIKCRPFDDWAVWKRWIGNNDDAGKNRLALLVKTLMLRRTKAELCKKTSFELPTKNIHTVNVEFFKEEKNVYEKVLLFSSKLFASYLCEKAEKENAIGGDFSVKNKTDYLHQQDLNKDIFRDHPELDKLFKQLKNNTNIQAHHILVLITRLRQLCCHPCLMKNMLENESLKIDGIQDTDDLEIVDTMSRMSIGVPIVKKEPSMISNPIFNDSWVSSKIKSVCDMVNEKVLNTDDKAVIVSQWPSVLLLVDKQLKTYKVQTAMFSGAIPVPKRNKIVNEFNKSKGGPKILLLSLTAGGVGLNLVAANHLFLVDIHWNPQLEAQACDRIYRVGQTKPVNVYKFICTNSIETSIQSIQSHKLTLASNILGGCSNIEGAKITLEDLKQIFQINQPNKTNHGV